MNVATHILLATDFSEASDDAIAKAGELARRFDAKLTVLHVHGFPPAPPEAVVPPERIVSSADLDADACAALDELKRGRLADVEWLSYAVLESGNVAQAICEYADNHGVDLIVIGSHARHGLAHFFAGSVAAKVLRQAHCPLLVVPDARVLAA